MYYFSSELKYLLVPFVPKKNKMIYGNNEVPVHKCVYKIVLLSLAPFFLRPTDNTHKST